MGSPTCTSLSQAGIEHATSEGGTTTVEELKIQRATGGPRPRAPTSTNVSIERHAGGGLRARLTIVPQAMKDHVSQRTFSALQITHSVRVFHRYYSILILLQLVTPRIIVSRLVLACFRMESWLDIPLSKSILQTETLLFVCLAYQISNDSQIC